MEPRLIDWLIVLRPKNQEKVIDNKRHGISCANDHVEL